MRALRLAMILVLAGGLLQIQPASAGSSFKLRKIGECKRVTPQDYWDTNSWMVGEILIESQPTNDYWDCRIYATDIKTCKRLWERELDCADTTGCTREGDRLYLINTQFVRERAFVKSTFGFDHVEGSPSIQCFDINTGKRIWINSFRAGTTRISNPVIIGDLVYAGFGKIFYAFRKSDGKEVWRYSSNDHLMTTLKGDLNTNTEVYAFGGKSWAYWGNDYFSLHCLDAKSGKLKWKYDRVGKRKSYRLLEGVGLTIERIEDYTWNNEMVFLNLYKECDKNNGRNCKSILALEKSNGKIVWEKEIDLSGWDFYKTETFFVLDNNLFVRINDLQYTTIIDTKTGNVLKKIKTSSVLSPSTERQAYIINYKGIEAVRFVEGKRVWYRPLQFCSSSEEAKTFGFKESFLEQDSKLFVSTNNGIFTLDADTGAILDSWKYKIKPMRISQTGERTIACEIKNADNSNTILLFGY